MPLLPNSSKSDRQHSSNPSLGLGIWGPLVPASDCKPCLASLAGLQLGAGALLWLRPGRRPPPMRSVWTNRLIKFGGMLGGSYLIFMAGIEFVRLGLPYDPWVEDAKNARKKSALKTMDSRSHWNPSTWWYRWFGPSNYQPVSRDKWQERLSAFMEKSSQARPHLEKIAEIHQNLANNNRSVANDVLNQIRTGKLPAPEIPVQDLETLALMPELEDEDEFFNEIDMSTADLWEFFEEPQPFSFVIVPRSTPAFTPGVTVADEEGLRSQNVNYMPIPKLIKNGLR